MPDWLHHGEWMGNPALAWIIAGAGALLGYIIAHSIVLFLKSRLHKLAERTHRSGFAIAAQVVSATRGWLLLLIAIAIALDFLHFGNSIKEIRNAQHWLHLLTYVLAGIQIAFWASALLVSVLRKSAEGDDSHAANPVMLGVLTWVARFLVWITLVLALLAEGGVNITAFVASLGVGGVAVALALQNVLGDLFASISIGLDKPFEVGEYIAFGSDQGTVTKVGIKSTRISSLSGEEMAISNSVLLKDLIHNYSRMQQRRVVFDFRLPFDTPREKIPEVVERVRAIIEAETPTRLDRGILSGVGDYGLDFEFVYYVLDPSYNTYAAIQQRIILKLLDVWSELGIRFAVPVRELSAHGEPALMAQATPAKE
ncbi:MAG TPA: mechanosensitive ion channel family protein [Rhodanobacteraceae bacterium]|nr:mechanosensitive ion channel family protein [Rhodanobacteraceae bacterium]